ncbi:probable proteasome subunit beta type-2 [Drosophila mauritiana]|uniref:Proteasome subunit beta n=1 Tax=Drosophila mauritiana TaxID=7226 RepID=A0A6P8L3R2_DROMA|nr:probable proteasome subunit beta type-2 [Drosophila mauritiana]
METILGVKGTDFVILASDTMISRSGMWLDDEVERTNRISDCCMMSTAGDGGDCQQFSDFIQRNMDFYKVTNGYDLTVHGAVHFIRSQLTAYRKSNCNYKVALLVGGYDLSSGPELHYMDYFGNSVPVRYGGHGIGINFCTPIIEEFYKPDMDTQAAYDVIKKCVIELYKRFVINLRNFDLFLINKEGITKMNRINLESFRGDFLAGPKRRI